MQRSPIAALSLLLALAAPTHAQVSGSGGIDPPKELSPDGKPDTKLAKPRSTEGLIDLRPKFRANEPFKLRIQQSSTGTSLVQDASQLDSTKAEPQDQTMTQVFELRFVAKDVAPDGSATVDMIVDAVKMDFKSGDMNASFDSRAPKSTNTPGSKGKQVTTKPSQVKPSPNQPKQAPTPTGTPALPQDQLAEMDENQLLASVVGPLVGSTTTLKFDASGNVTQVTGGEAWNFAGLASLTGTPMPGASSSAAFGQLLNIRPGSNRARLGETWTTDAGATNSPVGNFSMNTRYTLRGASAQSATIDFTGAVEPGTDSMLGMQVREATYRGDATWDTGLGFLRAMQSTTHVVLEGTLAGNHARLDTTAKLDVKLIK